jgi:hypothetical protein
MEKEIAELASVARRDRVAPGCTEIVADRSQPEIARERALGGVITAGGACTAGDGRHHVDRGIPD